MLFGFNTAVTRHHRITFGRYLRINKKADASCTAQKRLNAVSCFSKHRSFPADEATRHMAASCALPVIRRREPFRWLLWTAGANSESGTVRNRWQTCWDAHWAGGRRETANLHYDYEPCAKSFPRSPSGSAQVILTRALTVVTKQCAHTSRYIHHSITSCRYARM